MWIAIGAEFLGKEASAFVYNGCNELGRQHQPHSNEVVRGSETPTATNVGRLVDEDKTVEGKSHCASQRGANLHEVVIAGHTNVVEEASDPFCITLLIHVHYIPMVGVVNERQSLIGPPRDLRK